MSVVLSKITWFFGLFSSDMIFIATLFVISFAFTLYFGRGMLVAFIVAFYPSSILFNSFPFMNKVFFLHSQKLLVLNKIFVFLVFLIPLTIIINRFIFSASEYNGSYKILRSGGLALSVTIIVILFSYGTVSFDVLHNFSTPIDTLFAGNNRLFYWNLAPLALMALL